METDKTVEKPWLFQKGQPSANPNGRPKGTFSLKTYAKKYLQEMTDDEKLDFMEGLPKEVVWKMAEGNAANELTGKDGKDLIPNIETKERVESIISDYLNGASRNNK